MHLFSPRNDKHGASKSKRRLPNTIGITFNDRVVHIVHLSFDDGTADRPSSVVLTVPNNGNVGAAIRDALDAHQVPDAPAILGLSAAQAIVGQQTFAPRLSFAECVNTVRVRDPYSILNVASREQLAIVLSLRKDRTGTYGVTDNKVLSDYEKISDEAGLNLLAVDHAGFAWRRAIGAFTSANGVIDVTDTSVHVYVFTPDVFKAQSFERDGTSTAWTEPVGAFLRGLRSDSNGEIDPGHLLMFGDDLDMSVRYDILSHSSAEVSALEVPHPQTGTPEYGPPWMLAYGLAMYEVA